MSEDQPPTGLSPQRLDEIRRELATAYDEAEPDEPDQRMPLSIKAALYLLREGQDNGERVVFTTCQGCPTIQDPHVHLVQSDHGLDALLQTLQANPRLPASLSQRRTST